MNMAHHVDDSFPWVISTRIHRRPFPLEIKPNGSQNIQGTHKLIRPLGQAASPYGLTERALLCQAFLSIVIEAGFLFLSVDEDTGRSTTMLAADLAPGHDKYAIRSIKEFRKRESHEKSKMYL
jgi:hypothetical protein